MGVRLWVENSFAPGVGLVSFSHPLRFILQFLDDVLWILGYLIDDECDGLLRIDVRMTSLVLFLW